MKKLKNEKEEKKKEGADSLYAYDREALQQVLRNDVGGKLLNGIKKIYDDNLAGVRVKEDEVVSQNRYWCKAIVRHVPLSFQCNGLSNERMKMEIWRI